MYLSMLAIEASDGAQVPEGLVFRWAAHHVKEVYLALMPKKFVLDGSSKVQITCGPKGAELQYQQVLGASNYYAELDFALFNRVLPTERDEMALGVLEASLIAMGRCQRDWSDTKESVVNATAAMVRERDFRLCLPVRKLSKTLPRKCKIDVYRNLSREDGEAWSCEIRDKEKVIHKEWLGKRPNYLNRTDFYKRSGIVGSLFQIQCRLGIVVFELDVGKIIDS